MRFFDTKKPYRKVFILESRAWWESCSQHFDIEQDIVLTYDFALKIEVESLGGNAYYIDHLVDKQLMQKNNFLAYKFFRDWHLDSNGADIFSYRGIPFGFAFRLQIWNDYISYIRNRTCLECLRDIQFSELFVGTEIRLVESILGEMGLPFSKVNSREKIVNRTYFFPIFRWMDERIRTRTLKHIFRDTVTALQGIVMLRVDRLLGREKITGIFLQEYYPTKDLLQQIKRDKNIRLVLAHFSWSKNFLKYFTERPIPVWGKNENYQFIANRLLDDFQMRRCSALILVNGVDITDSAYRIIEQRVREQIVETLCALDCVVNYLDANPIKLAVLIANIGLISTLVDCVCRARNIPSYLIINGLMSGDFLDESKYASVINSYSISIKENYFRGMNNVVCLGDPRMDYYVKAHPPRLINHEAPTVTIGTSAYSPIDLNSYVAVEFEFMHDVLSALKIVKDQGTKLRVIIKVRTNGYRDQYINFVQEYFPGLVDEFLDVIPFSEVIKQTDFYISLYSQTLFEASCLGIPCVYYKNDSEIIDPPFDGNSELVTVSNVGDLVSAIIDFQSDHERFLPFLDRAVMEKYIGPLDGNNLERNLSFIRQLIENKGVLSPNQTY
jgi:hypothetical protein